MKPTKKNGVFIDSLGREWNPYTGTRNYPEPNQPQHQGIFRRHPVWTVLGFTIGFVVLFFIGVVRQAIPRGIGKHWA